MSLAQSRICFSIRPRGDGSFIRHAWDPRRRAPCRRHAPHGVRDDSETRSAGDTVLIIALSPAEQRETLARRSTTCAPRGAIRPRVAPPHTRPRFGMAPAAADSLKS